MASVFTRIIDGDLPGVFVHRDARCVVIMSINPLAPGHCLVVPIREVDHWVDLTVDEAQHLFSVAHRVAQAQRAAFLCTKVGMIIAGYEVPHAHIHLVPTTNMRQLDFANAAVTASRQDLEAAAAAIRNQIGS